MMKSTLLALSLIFVAAVECSSSATPQPCCTADQLEVNFGAVENAGSSATVEFFKGAFDFENRQYGMYVHVHRYDIPNMAYKVIQLFNKGEEYAIMGEECYRMAPSNEPQQCVPDTANYTTSFFLGNQALLVDVWHQSTYVAEGIKFDTRVTTSRYDCTPGQVSFIEIQEEISEQWTLSGMFMNFTKGISYPDQWFVPPASCDNATFVTDEGKWPHIQHWRRMRAMQMIL